MLHDARPIQAKHVRDRQLPARNVQMHEPDVVVERLVHDGPVHARDQILEEGDGGGASLRRVGRVVDVVRIDVGQVGGRGVLEGVELVDEVEEDGVLLARAGGLGGAVWP